MVEGLLDATDELWCHHRGDDDRYDGHLEDRAPRPDLEFAIGFRDQVKQPSNSSLENQQT